MSIQFRDSSTYKGLVEIFEREVGFSIGDVSGDSTKLKEFTVDANLALDDFIEMAIRSSGLWQFDDTNQTDYTILTTNINDGQRDYTFTSDENGNLILDIHKVLVKATTTGFYEEIYPVDVNTQENTETFTDGNNTEGAPYRYDKLSNGIFLDPIPSVTVASGLKVYVSREGSYFTSSDTTKKPGVPGLFHKYFALRPAQEYARRNSLTSYDRISLEVSKMEEKIISYFGRRERDRKKVLSAKSFNFR